MEFEVVNDYFNLSIDGCSQSISEASEDYGLNLNYRLWIEMDSNQSDLLEKIMMFIGSCMKRLNGNCILLSNGDTPILIRNNVKTIVDDTRLRGTKKFPFEKLGIQFEISEI